MKAGLIDILNGQFLNGQKVVDVEEEQQRIMSILDNLNRLFNTRRSSIGHLEDYGLPDITEIYRELPYSVEALRQAIQDSVQKYEPRLKNVRIENQTDDPYSMRITFILSADLLEGRSVQFQTTFTSNELAHVSEKRKPA